MTTIVLFNEDDPTTEVLRTSDYEEIAQVLSKRGVLLERWDACVQLDVGATDEQVMEAYAADIDRLGKQGYSTVDVLRVVRDPAETDWAAKAKGAREKYLDEHTHDDDEVRFFVEGSGIFYIRMDGEVLATHCVTGDLLSLPAGTTHWFDMGKEPHVAVIRLFRVVEGWVADFTGDPISRSFPTFDQLVDSQG